MTPADESGLIGRLDTQVLLGDEVRVLDIRDAWAQVAVIDQATPLDGRGYPVWLPVRQLTTGAPPQSDRWITVIAPGARLQSKGAVVEVSFGTRLPLVGEEPNAFQVGLPGGEVSTIAAGAAVLGPVVPSADTIIAAARRFLGLPYLWGGTSSFGFDCSGLVHVVYKADGVVLPRDADPQSKVGEPVSRANLRPGDLVFFASQGSVYHVAIYVGSGMVIESPAPGYPVEEVALASMPIIGDYAGARRVISRA